MGYKSTNSIFVRFSRVSLDPEFDLTNPLGIENISMSK